MNWPTKQDNLKIKKETLKRENPLLKEKIKRLEESKKVKKDKRGKNTEDQKTKYRELQENNIHTKAELEVANAERDAANETIKSLYEKIRNTKAEKEDITVLDIEQEETIVEDRKNLLIADSNRFHMKEILNEDQWEIRYDIYNRKQLTKLAE